MRRPVARGAIAAALFAASSFPAGCRSASLVGEIDPQPVSQTAVETAENAEIAALPDGPAKTLVAERCLLCHSAGLITQQRKDAAAWGRTVTQMRTWGTPIQDEDQTALVAYLTRHFGPGSTQR
jgi:cytochrome c5